MFFVFFSIPPLLADYVSFVAILSVPDCCDVPSLTFFHTGANKYEGLGSFFFFRAKIKGHTPACLSPGCVATMEEAGSPLPCA